MIKSTTISCVDLSDVLELLDLPPNVHEALMDNGFDWISFGDASYTLVGNNMFISLVKEYLSRVHQYTNESLDEMEAKYWANIGDQDYINMEG